MRTQTKRALSADNASDASGRTPDHAHSETHSQSDVGAVRVSINVKSWTESNCCWHVLGHDQCTEAAHDKTRIR